MYDRAGLGESTFVDPHTRTLSDLVNELHRLAVDENWGKMMLVPHSFAGFIARAYTDRYPEEILGILFLDVAHEDWLPRLQAQMSAADWAIMERILAWNEATFQEDYIEAQEAVRGTQLRDNLPITILSRGIPHTRIRLEHMSYEGIDIYEREHNALQADLLNLSSNSVRRIAEYSSHVFNDYDPWLVIEEINLLAHRIEEATEGCRLTRRCR
jgi:pimeloyl-ACP methyl ester carboxylesterase